MKNFDYEKFANVIAEAVVHALNEKEFGRKKSCLNHRCQSHAKSDYEVLDPTPLAVPLDCKVPESMDAIMARHIQAYMSKMANQEAYDFDDDISELDTEDGFEADFVSKHEYVREPVTIPNIDKGVSDSVPSPSDSAEGKPENVPEQKSAEKE